MLENWLYQKTKLKIKYRFDIFQYFTQFNTPIIRRIRVCVPTMYGRIFYVKFERWRITFVIVIDDIFIFLYFGRHHPSQNLQTHIRQRTM